MIRIGTSTASPKLCCCIQRQAREGGRHRLIPYSSVQYVHEQCLLHSTPTTDVILRDQTGTLVKFSRSPPCADHCSARGGLARLWPCWLLRAGSLACLQAFTNGCLARHHVCLVQFKGHRMNTNARHQSKRHSPPTPRVVRSSQSGPETRNRDVLHNMRLTLQQASSILARSAIPGIQIKDIARTRRLQRIGSGVCGREQKQTLLRRVSSRLQLLLLLLRLARSLFWHGESPRATTLLVCAGRGRIPTHMHARKRRQRPCIFLIPATPALDDELFKPLAFYRRGVAWVEFRLKCG